MIDPFHLEAYGQIAVNYKSIVGERQKKKRRGLYEKQR